MNEVNSNRGPLANKLVDKVRRDGETVKAVAQHLGISQSYLAQLLAGDRDFSVIDTAVLRKVASYLELPAVICFLLSGKICNADFYEPRIELDTQVDRALYLVAESSYGLETAVEITELQALPAKIKLLVVLLYQAARETELITDKKRWPWTSDTVSPFSQLF